MQSDDLMPRSPAIGKLALVGIFWSLLTNWGARLATFVLFVVLARFLSPEQYGVVAAANVILMFIALVAEFGLSDAIVQRPNLKPDDINLPFFVSVFVSIVASLVAALLSSRIELWMEVPGIALVIVWLSALTPISTVSLFQETIYRRNFAFKGLAARALVGNVIAGPAAIAAAFLGAGIWSLVLLSYLTVAVGALWLWMFPQWLPSLRVNFQAFKELVRFGLSVVVMRVVDFFTLRLIDIIILHKFGVAAFGIYTVGSRLYQILLQLLQSGLNNVSLSVLSRISADQNRMADIYLRAIAISGLIGAPVFVFCAASSPEICDLLFGDKWNGVADISAPLLLLGGVQCVQYLNGPYLSARGRPHIVLYIALLKYAVVVCGLISISPSNIVAMVAIFCLLQLIATPLTFAAISFDLKIPPVHLMRTIINIALCNIAGYVSVFLLRDHFVVSMPSSRGASFTTFLDIMMLGFGFALSFFAAVGIFARAEFLVIVGFARRVLKHSAID